MEKFIPEEKLSKKKRKELNSLRRTTWGSISPITRKTPNPRAYNRRKAQKPEFDPSSVPCFFMNF